jgi:hypothetical protein
MRVRTGHGSEYLERLPATSSVLTEALIGNVGDADLQHSEVGLFEEIEPALFNARIAIVSTLRAPDPP